MTDAPLIDTARGLLSIDQVVVGDIVLTSRGGRSVREVAHCGILPSIELRLSNGAEIRMPRGRHVRSRGAWVAVEDLSPGDPLCLSMLDGLFGDRTALRLAYATHRMTPNAPRLPVEWTPDLAEFIGYAAGRGRIYRRATYNSVAVSVPLESMDYLERLSDIARSEFDRSPTRETSSEAGPTLHFHSIDVMGIFTQLLYDGSDGKERRAPAGLFTAPASINAAFLRGYFESTGSVSHQSGIWMVARHPRLARDAQRLLSLFGIASVVRLNHHPTEDRESDERVVVRGAEAKRLFAERIGFGSQRKKSALAEFMARTDQRDDMVITLPSDFDLNRSKKAIYDHYRGPDGRVHQNHVARVGRFTREGVTGMTISMARWILEATRSSAARDPRVIDDMKFLEEIVEGRYVEVAIDSARAREPASTWAIRVDGDFGYMADGVVVNDPDALLRLRSLVVGIDDAVPESRSPLVQGSLVNTQRGLVAIENVVVGDIIRTPSGSAPVLAARDELSEETVTISLSNGRSISCAPQALFRSLGGWARADSILAGDPLYSSHATGLFGNTVDLHLHSTANDPISGRTEVVLPSRLTDDLAEYLGFALAHGPGARENGRICALHHQVDPRDEDLMTRMVSIIRSVFHKEPTINRRRRIILSIHSLDIGGMMEQIGMGGRMEERRLPAVIMTAPMSVTRSFLRGYLERRLLFGKRASDRLPPIIVSCAGRTLAAQLAELLSRFGINTLLRSTPPMGPRKYSYYYLIVTPVESKRRIIERIGFISERRRRIGDDLLSIVDAYDESMARHVDALTLPPHSDLDGLRKEILRWRRQPESPTEKRDIYERLGTHVMQMIVDGKTRMTRPRARSIVMEIPRELIAKTVPIILESVEGEYCEVRVTEVTRSGRRPTIALGVNSEYGFIVDGVVTR